MTGCTGLLGSWLTAALVEEGASVVGLIRDTVPRTNFLRLRLNEHIATVRGQVEDYFLLERILGGIRDRDRLSPGRADDRDHGQPESSINL